MYVGIVRLSLAIDQSHSLKEKRMVLRRLRDRVRERLGVALSEVGDQELWQRAQVGCAVVSGERRKVGELIDQVVRVVGGTDGAAILAIAREVVTFQAPGAPVGVSDGVGAPAEVTARAGAGDKLAGAADGWVPAAWLAADAADEPDEPDDPGDPSGSGRGGAR
jgi:hypothetical protein